MVWDTVTAYNHFGSSVANFPFTHVTMYIAISTLVINIVVAVVLTIVLRAVKAPAGGDETEPDDYYSDAAKPEVARAEERATV